MTPAVLRSIALLLVLIASTATAAFAADEPDLIFKRSTVFKWVSPNDKLATYGLDDPLVEGVACHFTVPQKGGFRFLRLCRRPEPRRSEHQRIIYRRRLMKKEHDVSHAVSLRL